MPLKLTVEGFSEGGNIPRRSPATERDEPSEARSFVLIMDADAPGGFWSHWLVRDIPSSVHSIPEGTSTGKSGIND